MMVYSCNESGYDQGTKKYWREYSLDDKRLCFLTVFLTEQQEIESISFDVEHADDYHYQIKADQLPKLSKALSCPNTETDIAAMFAERVKSWKDPIEIASFLKQAEVAYQVFHWY